MEDVFLFQKKLEFFIGFDFEGENLNSADNFYISDRNPVNILPLGTWPLVLNQIIIQHSFTDYLIENALLSNLQKVISIFRTSSQKNNNKFGNGTHLT